MKRKTSTLPPPAAAPDTSDFLDAVRDGLRRRPRSIPPKYFYDARGSELFDLICDTPEYYPTRTETGILDRFGARMAELCGANCVLIELGSGSATKTPLLLRHLSQHAVYMPIEICAPHLEHSTRRLQAMFPAMRMRPVCADYTRLPALPLEHHPGQRRVVFFPGSTIGNCTPDEARALLRQAAQLTGKGGGSHRNASTPLTTTATAIPPLSTSICCTGCGANWAPSWTRKASNITPITMPAWAG
jgi:L-histidine N-alpha-methyltransferase